jgi:sugar (pentulose or hexulose) kinase
MLADVMERPLQPVEVAAASALGAADLGARAAGLSTIARPHRDNRAPALVPGGDRRLYLDRRRTYRHTVDALHASDRPQPRGDSA